MKRKTNTPQVLVLGSTGMLGHMVLRYLQKNSHFTVAGTARKKISGLLAFDALDFLHYPESVQIFSGVEYVINCIGIIKPHCHDDNQTEVENAIAINALFPHRLADFLKKHQPKAKIIQIATDCVYSGKEGDYLESSLHDPIDVYGKTKSLGEVRSENLLNIRCSIIGPEKETQLSLLEWFLHQPPNAHLSGFTNHFWNGVTTLQYAELCEKIIFTESFSRLRKTHFLHHFLPNGKVSKYELLQIFQSVFKTTFSIAKTQAETGKVDRSLKTQFSDLEQIFPASSMITAITQLERFTNGKKI